MKIFEDKLCSKELNDLYLGIVEAGKTVRYEFYILNEKTSYIRDLKFFTSHPEVTIVSAPESLNSGDTGTLILEWSPSVTLLEGLETKISYKGKEIWGKIL